MPHGDGTGPMGMGSRTGRAAGFCAGFGMPGYASAADARGFGALRARGGGRGPMAAGRGGGRGWRNQFYATGLPGWMRFGAQGAQGFAPDPEMEKQALRTQAEALRTQIEALEKRLGEMDAKPSEE